MEVIDLQRQVNFDLNLLTNLPNSVAYDIFVCTRTC